MNFYNINKEKYVSWKDNTNTIIIAKNVKNKNNYIDSCNNKKCNNKFNARPINHYRKEYSIENNITSKSNNSVIGTFNKPGNYIVTSNKDNNCLNCDTKNTTNLAINIKDDNNCCENTKYYDKNKHKLYVTGNNPKNLVIKRASTVINDFSYCSTNKELLEKKCKTYLKNLPNNTDININNGTMLNCNENNCKITYNPSNKRYNNQGAISSSARTSALKYCNQDVSSRRCYIENTDYNNKVNLSSRDINSNVKCNNNICKKVRRINILA